MQLPTPFIKEEDYQIAARNLFLNAEFYRTQKILSNQNIALIPLKGIALIQNIYSDIETRYIGDIDILVKAKDVLKTAELFESEGYTCPRIYFNPKRPYSYYLNSLSFSREEQVPYSVHLHWHLLNSTLPQVMYSINIKDVWQKAKIERSKDREILMLDSPHQLIYLSMHAFKHTFNKQSLLVDIKKTMQFYGSDLNWQEVIRVAKNWNASLPLYYSLYFTHKILEVDIPQDVLNLLKPPRLSRVEKIMIDSVGRGDQPRDKLIYSLYLKMVGNIFRKIKFVFLFFFPAPKQIIQIYPPAENESILINTLKRYVRRLTAALKEIHKF